MLDARIEVHSETLKSHCESRYRAMANIMALIEAVNTGKRVHPDKFYSGPSRKKTVTNEPINLAGFAAMKSLFTSN